MLRAVHDGRHGTTAAPSRSIRRLAILAPMPNELAPLVRLMALERSGPPHRRLWRGSLGAIEIVAARSGIGMGNARATTERLLDEASPDHLFVVGIAGGIGSAARIGAAIHPAQVRNLDTGDELRPAQLGGDEADGILASSDRFLGADEALALAGEGVIAVDMETAAVGSVCERRGCPWSVYRAISDRADDGSTDPAVLRLVDAEGRPRPLAVARLLLARPRLLGPLVRLARGTRRATRSAAHAAIEALGAS